MTSDKNLFPELSGEPEQNLDPEDHLSSDPDIRPHVFPEMEAALSAPEPDLALPSTEPIRAVVSDTQPVPVVENTAAGAPEEISAPVPASGNGSVPPPPSDGNMAGSPLPPPQDPSDKRTKRFLAWAIPALFVVLILIIVLLRAWMVRRIADISLELVSPVSAQTVYSNQPFEVVSRIHSSKGWSKIELYVNNQLYRVDKSDQNSTNDQEIRQTWIPSALGPTMLKLRVTNKRGDQSASQEVAVQIVSIESGATVQPTSSVTPTITLTPTKGPNPTPCTDLFEVVSESGLNPETMMEKTVPFAKSWKIRNVGSCLWEGYKFVFESGSLLGTTSPIPVPKTAPGGTADLNLHLLSPSIPGNFVGKWRIQNRRGDIFGSPFTYSLVIASPTPTITLTPTMTATPRPTNTELPTQTPTETPVTPTAETPPSLTFTPTDTPTATATPTPTNSALITQIVYSTEGTPTVISFWATWTPSPTPTVTDVPAP